MRATPMFKLLGQMWILVPCTIYVIAYGICNREFPGLNPINATVYLLGGILLIPSYIQAPRTYALSEIRRYGASEMPVFSKKYTYKRDGSNFTWAGIDEKSYRNVCPKCGVVSTASLKHCNNCGTSLEVLDSTMGLGTLEFYRDDD